MLKPSKHSHPDRTVINVALLLLTQLRAKRLCEYDALFKHARKAVTGGDILFLPALNFLYLMGLVEYHAKNDALEYVGQNDNI